MNVGNNWGMSGRRGEGQSSAYRCQTFRVERGRSVVYHSPSRDPNKGLPPNGVGCYGKAESSV